MSRKERPKWFEFTPLKKRRRKEVKEDPNSMAYGRFQCLLVFGRFQCLVVFGRFQCLVANGKFQCLEANERFQCSLSLKGSNGRFQCLVVFEKRKRKILFTSYHFPPQQFYYNIFFSIDLKVLLYHGSKPYTFFFPWTINYNHASWCTKSFTHSLLNWFWLRIFFSFPWIHGIAHDHFLRASNYTSEWRIASKFILRFDIDATSSWWRISNHERCTLILKLNPLKLGIITFL